jgi:hypothetical protein
MAEDAMLAAADGDTPLFGFTKFFPQHTFIWPYDWVQLS